MANPGYVRSTDGDNADNGSTWALANADAAGAIADAVAGDRIWFSDAHSETTNSTLTLVFPGTCASPNQLLCGDDVAEPPTTLTTTAVIATGAGSYSLNLNGSFYAYGISFRAGVGGSGTNASVTTGVNNGYQFFENCVLEIASTSNLPVMYLGGDTANSESRHDFKNCTFTFAHVQHAITLRNAVIRITGGSFSGSALTTAFIANNLHVNAIITGFDMSNCASTVNLVNGLNGIGRVVFRNCKLPASWTGGVLVATPNTYGMRVELINCSASDTNYALWVEDYCGSIKHETTLVKTSGASDGTTPLSWKMTSNANPEYPHQVLVSPDIQQWNETVGSSITVTVDFLHDSATNLQDDEIWLEVEYLGTSGVPLSLFVDDAAADILATPADQTTSAATWTTTGMSNPNEQKLSVTFTPQEKGAIIARVYLAKASYAVYVDPLLQVS